MTTPLEFDATEFGVEYAKAQTDRILGALASGVVHLKSSVQARFRSSYGKYVLRLSEQYATSKSFFSRSEARPLYEFYIPLDLAVNGKLLTSPSSGELEAASRCSVIEASGGAGKSMFMRHLLLSALRERRRIPVMVELRKAKAGSHTIVELIRSALTTRGLDVDSVFVEAALKTGMVHLLLDGFDELTQDQRERVADEVRELPQRYPDVALTLSSRPDNALKGWDFFTVWSLAPLTLEKAVQLAERSGVERTLVDRFIVDMRRKLWSEHESFLSNPLLLSIMILTYSDVAHIPLKRSNFYSQAFETLFYRHDALKQGYKRERLCGLEIDEFARLFAAFALLGYEKREITVRRTRALELVRGAQNIAGVSTDPSKFLDDAIQSVCLLVDDGGDVGYAHRSFQEYFAARCICDSPSDIKSALLTRHTQPFEREGVVDLLWEMEPLFVEREFLLPALNDLARRVGVRKRVNRSHFCRYLQMGIGKIAAVPGTGTGLRFMVREGALVDLVWFVHVKYRSIDQMVATVPHEEVFRCFIEAAGEGRELDTSTLSATHPFVQALAGSAGIFSLRELREVFQVRADMEQRVSANSDTLRELLQLDAPQRKTEMSQQRRTQ